FSPSRRRHTRWKRDWSSDVCSSDLVPVPLNTLWKASDVRVVGRLPQCVERNRNRARLDRAEEAVDERRAVEEQQEHALFGTNAEDRKSGVEGRRGGIG